MLRDLYFRNINLAYFSCSVKRAGGRHEETRLEARKPVRGSLY